MRPVRLLRHIWWMFACAIVLAAALQTAPADAVVYSFSSPDDIIGTVREHKVRPNESLIEIARHFGLGYNEIMEANPGLDPFVPGAGKKVEIPSSWILPDVTSYSGLVINLAELRLYYFFDRQRIHYVMTFPIGIGREGLDTPIGVFTVMQKIVHPAWYVPDSIRKEEPSLPAVVPPGPDNPLGSHALRLSLGTVLIHGTNRPYGIGRRVSHGCIHLYPEDIPKLFASVRSGTKVTIVRQPIKVGVKGDRVYIEAHSDDSADGPRKANEGYYDEAVRLLAKKKLLARVSTKKLYSALEKRLGIPIDISE